MDNRTFRLATYKPQYTASHTDRQTTVSSHGNNWSYCVLLDDGLKMITITKPFIVGFRTGRWICFTSEAKLLHVVSRHVRSRDNRSMRVRVSDRRWDWVPYRWPYSKLIHDRLVRAMILLMFFILMTLRVMLIPNYFVKRQTIDTVCTHSSPNKDPQNCCPPSEVADAVTHCHILNFHRTKTPL